MITPIVAGGVVGRRDRRDRLGEDGDGEHDADGDGDEQQQYGAAGRECASPPARLRLHPAASTAYADGGLRLQADGSTKIASSDGPTLTVDRQWNSARTSRHGLRRWRVCQITHRKSSYLPSPPPAPSAEAGVFRRCRIALGLPRCEFLTALTHARSLAARRAVVLASTAQRWFRQRSSGERCDYRVLVTSCG